MLKKLLIILILLSAFIILGVTLFNAYKHTDTKENEPISEVEVGVVDKQNGEPLPFNGGLDNSIQRARASWYNRSVCGQRIYGETCKTANGEIFNEDAFTMACSYDFALGDRVELCYRDNCAISRCNDRGNFERLGITFDLSSGLFEYLASNLDLGVIEVSYRIMYEQYE